MDTFLVLVLLSAWTLLAWMGGWKACEMWARHCRASEEVANRFGGLVHPPSLPLPHPARVARAQKKAWESMKQVDQEWR